MAKVLQEVVGLIVGRFQPLHPGHIKLIEHAAEKVDILYIGIGSANKRDIKNPFSAFERELMLTWSLSKETLKKVKFFCIDDVSDDEKWLEKLDKTVPKIDTIFSSDSTMTALFNVHLNFKGKVQEIPLEDREMLSGTNMRRMIANGEDYLKHMPKGTRNVFALMSLETKIEIKDAKREGRSSENKKKITR